MLLEILENYWKLQKINLPLGCDNSSIITFEKINREKLHIELRNYFLKFNGMGGRDQYDNDFFSFWPLESVEKLDHFLPSNNDILKYSDFFVFADHSICLPCYAIRLSTDGEGHHPVIAVFADTELRVSVVAASLNIFINRYLNSEIERNNLSSGF